MLEMTKSKIPERLQYLAELFNVYATDIESIELLTLKLKNQVGSEISWISKTGVASKDIEKSECLAVLTECLNSVEKNKLVKTLYVSVDTFASIIAADPTVNKIYVQWMLSVFVNLIKKDGNFDSAQRFVSEDLPQTKDYLELFESNKRKNKFIKFCKDSYSLKGITDPSNINQYKNLSELFDAVDPFIVRGESSQIEKVLLKMVERGYAEIPVRDRNFTLYIPLTRDASEVFGPFTSWCTASKGNTMFNSYTNYKTPSGGLSKLYIIIPTEFFKGNSSPDNLVQVHFESSQIMDRKDHSKSIYEPILSKSQGIANYFYEELMIHSKVHIKTKGFGNCNYIKYLMEFGFPESIFELQEINVPCISFSKMRIPKMPDMSRFKNLDSIIIADGELTEIHPSICNLERVEMMAFPNNKLKTIPEEIKKMKNLMFLNLCDNEITSMPDGIRYLCPSNGGSLLKLAINRKSLGELNYEKLKKMLPQVIIL